MFLNETFVDINFVLLKTLTNPIWGIEVTRWGPGKSSTNFLNTSALVCEVERLSRRNVFLKGFHEAAKEMTNFTLACPIPAGPYFIRFSMDGLKKIFPGRLFYQPDTFIMVFFRFYEQKQKRNHTFFAHTLFNFKIKRYC